MCKSELDTVEVVLKFYFGNSYIRTLLTHKHSHAARFSGELVGSLNTVHSSSALIYAKQNKQNTDAATVAPAFVQKYVTVNDILQCAVEQVHQSIHLAGINWLGEHEYKNWFGSPV